VTAPRPHHPSRAVRFCSEEKPRCPHGHRLSTQHRPSLDGSLTCQHQAHRGAPPCGALCWVALMHVGGTMRRGDGERLWVVVEVTRPELRELQDVPRTVLEKLAYLGCVPEGVLFDLLGGATE
jgi:hypothetical protein